jgi:hypothetical protein
VPQSAVKRLVKYLLLLRFYLMAFVFLQTELH